MLFLGNLVFIYLDVVKVRAFGTTTNLSIILYGSCLFGRLNLPVLIFGLLCCDAGILGHLV